MGNVGTILGEVETVSKFINDHKGGVTLTSGRITYPKGLPDTDTGIATDGVPAASFKSTLAILLAHQNALTADDNISFNVEGTFGFAAVDGVLQVDRPVMVNVVINFGQNSDVFGTTVDLNAVESPTTFGTPDSPRVQFGLLGKFSSLAGGECQFTATMQFDNESNIFVIDSRIISGDADISPAGTIGVMRVTL